MPELLHAVGMGCMQVIHVHASHSCAWKPFTFITQFYSASHPSEAPCHADSSTSPHAHASTQHVSSCIHRNHVMLIRTMPDVLSCADVPHLQAVLEQKRADNYHRTEHYMHQNMHAFDKTENMLNTKRDAGAWYVHPSGVIREATFCRHHICKPTTDGCPFAHSLLPSGPPVHSSTRPMPCVTHTFVLLGQAPQRSN